MPGYLLMNAEVTDPAGYEEYKTEVAGIVAHFGGRYLVRGGDAGPTEGRWYPRFVLIEFPSYDDAVAFYESGDYQALRGIRHRCADSTLAIMQGLPGS
jgi:uncharacterized protein (DUF1330 family)